jgi:hypothetical protein
VYFDVSYAEQVTSNVKEYPGKTASLTSISNDDDISDYANLLNTQPRKFYNNDVYSCNEDVMLHKQYQK